MLPKGSIWRKKKKIIENTQIFIGIGRKHECFVKNKNNCENEKILLLNLLLPYYWYHYMSKRTCYTVGSQKPTEKSQSFYLNPALHNQLNFRIFLLISTLFLFPCTAAAALPRAADSAVIPLKYTCMYVRLLRSVGNG